MSANVFALVELNLDTAVDQNLFSFRAVSYTGLWHEGFSFDLRDQTHMTFRSSRLHLAC